MGNASLFFNSMTGGLGNNINCCLIAKVQDYNSSKNTITAIPMSQPSGNKIPPLVEVPVMVFGTQDYQIKFEIKANDMVLLLFNDYDMDNLSLDGVTSQSASDRTHSINDSIALPFYFNPIKTQFEGSNMFTIGSKNDIELKYGSSSIKVTEIVQRLESLENRVTILEGKV